CEKAVGKYSNNDTEPGGYTVEGCVGAYMVTQALKELGPDATGEEIMKYFDTHVIDTQGVTPPLHFGFNPTLPHLPFDKVQVVQVKDGHWTSVSDFFTAKVTPVPQTSS